MYQSSSIQEVKGTIAVHGENEITNLLSALTSNGYTIRATYVPLHDVFRQELGDFKTIEPYYRIEYSKKMYP